MRRASPTPIMASATRLRPSSCAEGGFNAVINGVWCGPAEERDDGRCNWGDLGCPTGRNVSVTGDRVRGIVGKEAGGYFLDTVESIDGASAEEGVAIVEGGNEETNLSDIAKTPDKARLTRTSTRAAEDSVASVVASTQSGSATSGKCIPDHHYALDHIQVKFKVGEAQKRIHELEKQLRNAKDRERRLKLTVKSLIQTRS
ncbi:hypothetical protein NHX12_012385 [Muraenolepis orangiensis]|uniref:Uncharacterized protein n=1 Tax=Muraenolepis orangiensis TaxID=630683 RepID=A0A9Q0DCF6_9TELE|nr:hypothetical protein NHX12_012385 [Muraenolepis orangiensis]